MKFQTDALILSHTQLNDLEYEILMECPEIAREARPGQFIQILYDQTYNPYTRRPFSVYKTDPEKGLLSIVYLARGVFTNGLRDKHAGHKLSLVGPLGNSFEPEDTSGITHILVAGGVGAPPLYFLAHQMLKTGNFAGSISVINGARTRNLLVAVNEFSELGVDLHFTTDDGSLGARGIVTDTLRELIEQKNGRVSVYTCGPTPMLRAVSYVCLEKKVPCQVSVETMMPCGLGVCMGCVVKIRDTESEDGFVYKRSCQDGPVFHAEDILWD
jgi:dihydroorotate dehydrogenase electron transfer subunit